METLASKIGAMDRISQLPDFIVHHIFSFFGTTHAPLHLVRMSVLSKKWFHLTASFPILNFNIFNFKKALNLSRQRFFKYVEYTTSRFCNHNLTATNFKLITTIKDLAELDIVNICLELVLKNGVTDLVIYISYSLHSSMPKYRLPNILLSVSMLKSLIIRGCDFPSSLMVDVVKFKSLIKLSLEKVSLDDEVIKCLTTSCPLLQVVRIRSCPGFKRFCVYGHQNLRELWIFYYSTDTLVERIDIEAPNLSCLSVTDWNGRGAPRMNLASCKNLTTVDYFGHPLPNSNGFNNFLSNFPFVENFALTTNYKCNNLKLSSRSLRTLMLRSTFAFEEIEFSCPNLVMFIYSRRLLWALLKYVFWPLVKHSTHLKGCMQCHPRHCVDALWFQKLRQFLDKKNGFKVFNLNINAIYSQKFTELEKLEAIELPPYELEHVELQLESHEESLAHLAFLNAVLWCCRPRSLTLRSSLTEFEEQRDVVKFTYEKLLQQEDQGHTKTHIVSPSSSDAQKHSRDLKSLSMGFPHEGKTITFIKEEVVQEEAG